MEKVKEAKRIASRKIYLKKNFLSKKGDGIKYLTYRVLRPLLKLYTHYRRSPYRPAPWLTPTSIAIFDKILTKEMIGLEYGSGRSTYFFSQRLKFLHSIEHDEDWYLLVSDKIKNNENVDLQLVKPQDPIQDPPLDFGIDNFKPKWEYRSYFSKVLEYEDSYFDFILIDGRARVECAINGIPKLKKGGILAIDNSERERYQPLFSILKDWDQVYTTNGLTDTTIWFKP